MVTAESDRNLLLGTLAPRMGSFGYDALFAAMIALILRKQTLLEALLAPLGELANPRRGLLQALDDEHVLAPGNDLTPCLLPIGNDWRRSSRANTSRHGRSW